MSYYEKYLKYKTKYLELKAQLGGEKSSCDIGIKINIKNKKPNSDFCGKKGTYSKSDIKDYDLKVAEKAAYDFEHCYLDKEKNECRDRVCNDYNNYKGKFNYVDQYEIKPNEKKINYVELCNNDTFGNCKYYDNEKKCNYKKCEDEIKDDACNKNKNECIWENDKCRKLECEDYSTESTFGSSSKSGKKSYSTTKSKCDQKGCFKDYKDGKEICVSYNPNPR
jgi:hypothetical protein